jgi:predicted ATP-grasp superfamily ATP-dependent carboligase
MPSSMNTDLPERLLIVSSSARMLARSAARAGLHPIALDLYADADTRECSEIAEATAPGRAGFDPDSLLEAAARLAPAEHYSLVYGSGMDVAPDLLERLAKGREVFGNPPEILRRLKTPDTFFALLRRLDIPFPEIRWNPPSDPQNWLVKSGCSEGGKGVRFCAQETPAGDGEYYQRRLPGPPMSVLFLADGERARIMGFNTMWTASHPGQPFLFAGAINRAELSRGQCEELRDCVARLVRAAGLKGLNSLDFMLDGGVCRVLEVNPRPSATMALYDRDFPEGLLARHIRACQGRLDDIGFPGRAVRAFRAVFAPRTVTVPEAVVWPDWCADRPVPGTSVPAGQPLCTIEAEGVECQEAEALLARRKTEIFERLKPVRA